MSVETVPDVNNKQVNTKPDEFNETDELHDSVLIIDVHDQRTIDRL